MRKEPTMSKLVSLLVGGAAIAAAVPARADDNQDKSVVVGAKLGGIAPFDGLSPFASAGVEVGYVLPVMEHQLAIVLDVDYTQPTKTGTESDPRVMGGTYTWKLTQQELGVMPVLLYRITSIAGVTPFVGAGPRVLLLKSTVQDNGAPSISMTTEQSTTIGGGLVGGAELPLGPGRLIGELLFQYGGLDHTATGDSHTAALSLSVGYRVLF
jgi:hypothetical protein